MPKNSKTIVYSLGAVKGVGEGAVESIVEARNLGGKFTDLYDFCRRVDTKRVNKRTLEALVKAGCFDTFAENLRPDLPADEKYQIRGALMAELPKAVQAAEQERQNEKLGIMDMFADIAEVTAAPPLPHTPIWTDNERLKFEKDTLGLYLTGHPIDTYRDELKRYTKFSLGTLAETGYGETAFFAGLILDVANFGNRVVIYLDDGTGRLEVSCYAEKFSRFKEKLKVDSVVIIEGNIRDRDGTFYASVNDVMTLTDARRRWLKKINIKISAFNMPLFEKLKTLLATANNSDIHYLSHQLNTPATNPPNQSPSQDNRDTYPKNNTNPQNQGNMSPVPSRQEKGQARFVPIALNVFTEYADTLPTLQANWQLDPDDDTLDKLKAWVEADALVLEF